MPQDLPTPPPFITSIAKEFTFDAAHFLPTVPEGHKCRRLHGHTYRVELVLRDYVFANGFCGGIDYDELARLWKEFVHDAVDHRLLNDIAGLEIPSTEVLGAWIIGRFIHPMTKQLRLPIDRVRVHESSTTVCEVSVLELRAAGVLPIPDMTRYPEKKS